MVSDDLHKRLKIEAVQSDMQMWDLTCLLLTEGLDKRQACKRPC